MRDAVAGKTASDIDKMVITGGLIGGPVTITDQKQITALLAGLQEAVRIDEKYPPGLIGPCLDVF